MREDPIPRFVRIPGGEFSMGSDEGDDDERPSHTVHVDAFYVSTHSVTVEQYGEFTKETGHGVPAVRDLPLVVTPAHEAVFRELAAPYVWRGGDPPRERARHPVTLVTHGDATAYCRWLSGRIGRLVRLPTEAEWERAARGGLNAQRYPWGDDVDASRANFLPDPALKRHRGTRPVGCYPPNALELYDMSGNVWEWVADWYRADAYRNADDRNPRGPGSGTLRLVRGGSWVTHDVQQLRCAHRHKVPPDTYAYSIGFRVVYSDDGSDA
ncbi:MAG: formylglycine-generating enzyme family protein [Vicinamibacterales bacterium]